MKVPLQTAEAIIDDEDYKLIKKHQWYLDKDGYAVTYTKNKEYIKMHRLILKACDDKLVDHVNNDRLDNRKDNLRLCNHAQNMVNRDSKNSNKNMRGVRKNNGKYHAYISENGKEKFLGSFLKKEEAALAYNIEAKKIYGEFARLNDVPSNTRLNRIYKSSSSKHKGICYNKKNKKWRCRLTINGNRIYLGEYNSEKEAINALKEGKKTK